MSCSSRITSNKIIFKANYLDAKDVEITRGKSESSSLKTNFVTLFFIYVESLKLNYDLTFRHCVWSGNEA